MPLIRQKFTEDFYLSSEFSKLVIFFPSSIVYKVGGEKHMKTVLCLFQSISLVDLTHRWCGKLCGLLYVLLLLCICHFVILCISCYVQLLNANSYYLLKQDATDIVLVLCKTPKTDVYVSVLNYVAAVSVCLCLLVYHL